MKCWAIITPYRNEFSNCPSCQAILEATLSMLLVQTTEESATNPLGNKIVSQIWFQSDESVRRLQPICRQGRCNRSTPDRDARLRRQDRPLPKAGWGSSLSGSADTREAEPRQPRRLQNLVHDQLWWAIRQRFGDYPRSHGQVFRAVACEARGPGFNSSSDLKVFSLLGYKVVGVKWIQTW